MKKKSNVRSHIRRKGKKVIPVKHHKRLITKKKKNYGAVTLTALAVVDKDSDYGKYLQQQRYKRLFTIKNIIDINKDRLPKDKLLELVDTLQGLKNEADKTEYLVPYRKIIDKSIAKKFSPGRVDNIRVGEKVFEEEFNLLALGELKGDKLPPHLAKQKGRDFDTKFTFKRFTEPEMGFRAMEKKVETPLLEKFDVLIKTGLRDTPGFLQPKGQFEKVRHEVRPKDIFKTLPGKKPETFPTTDIWTNKLDAIVNRFENISDVAGLES